MSFLLTLLASGDLTHLEIQHVMVLLLVVELRLIKWKNECFVDEPYKPVATYSVKSDFPKTKLLNLYLLVSLPASLPLTDYAKFPCLPHGKRPALAFF